MSTCILCKKDNNREEGEECIRCLKRICKKCLDSKNDYDFISVCDSCGVFSCCGSDKDEERFQISVDGGMYCDVCSPK